MDPKASQYIETSLECMKFCTSVMAKEMKRFTLNFISYQSFVNQLPGSLDVNFDIAYNRCAFLYKYTLSNMYFLKQCMDKFISECTEVKNLFLKWTVDSNLNLSSMSCGPGLDYLSFMLALSDHFSLPTFKNITILSKHGAWRNTVGIIADVLEEGAFSKGGIGKLLNFKNIEVVQTNLLISIPMKGIEALQHSSVILMIKTLNLSATGLNEEEIIKPKLLELISSLKPEATIFCIDTKPSLTLFLEVLSKFHGQFLYKPDHLSFKVPITFSEDYREKHGCFPVVSARGVFFVWQKLSSLEPDPNLTISHLDTLINIKETSQNTPKKALNQNVEILSNIELLKDLILPNQYVQPNPVGNIITSTLMNDNITESVSIAPNLFNTPKQFTDCKFSSIQNLFNNESPQKKIFEMNFDEKCSSSSLKKSSSIDNSFLQSCSKNISYLGESDLLQNYPLSSQTDVKTYPIFPHHNATKEKINENSNNSVSNSNQSLKPISESKATQTEMHQSLTNSSVIKDLTERVKRLVSSLENEVQKNIPDGQVNYHLHENSEINTNYSSCSINDSNNPDGDIKPPCSNCHQTELGNPLSCCNYAQMHHVHCCAVSCNMVHRCKIQCCRSCVHRCHGNSYIPPSGNNIVSTGYASPQIVIPLQNANNEALLQIILAAKSGLEFQ